MKHVLDKYPEHLEAFLPGYYKPDQMSDWAGILIHDKSHLDDSSPWRRLREVFILASQTLGETNEQSK